MRHDLRVQPGYIVTFCWIIHNVVEFRVTQPRACSRARAPVVDINLPLDSLRDAQFPLAVANTVHIQPMIAHGAEIEKRLALWRLFIAVEHSGDVDPIQRLGWVRKIAHCG